jgi:hypothetical protein
MTCVQHSNWWCNESNRCQNPFEKSPRSFHMSCHTSLPSFRNPTYKLAILIHTDWLYIEYDLFLFQCYCWLSDIFPYRMFMFWFLKLLLITVFFPSPFLFTSRCYFVGFLTTLLMAARNIKVEVLTHTPQQTDTGSRITSGLTRIHMRDLGICHDVLETFALLGCYMTWIGILLATFRYNQSAQQSWR